MLQTLELYRIGPTPEWSAQFGNRLNLFTGDNGLGKSFVLDICFWALTGSWPGNRMVIPTPPGRNGSKPPSIAYHPVGRKGLTRKPKEATFDFANQHWVRPQGRPAMSGLVIYAAVDGGFSVWDPARNYWRDAERGTTDEDEPPRAFNFTPDLLANGLSDGARVICNGLIRDWVSWWNQQYRDDSREPKPIDLLDQVVQRLSHPDEPITMGRPRRIYIDDSRDFPTFDLPYGNVAFPHLSAGVRRIVSLAYLIVWAWLEHRQAAQLRDEPPTDRMVLLVDELESHLHPKWQRVIVPALMDVAKSLAPSLQLQIIAATHSPLVLASLETLFDSDQDRLFLFELVDGRVEFSERPWVAHGDVVGWLTSELFGLRQARSRDAEQAIEAAEAFMRNDRAALPAELNTKDAIHQRLKQVLPGLDPFWPRWIVETRSS